MTDLFLRQTWVWNAKLRKSAPSDVWGCCGSRAHWPVMRVDHVCLWCSLFVGKPRHGWVSRDGWSHFGGGHEQGQGRFDFSVAWVSDFPLLFFNPAVVVCDIVSPETCLNCGRGTLWYLLPSQPWKSYRGKTSHQITSKKLDLPLWHASLYIWMGGGGGGGGGMTFKWIRSTIGKLNFLVVGKACMAIVWPAPGFQSGKLGGLSRGAHNLCICSCSSLPWTCKWQDAGGGGSWGGSCEVQVVGGSSSRKNNLEQADSVHYPVFDARKWACWLHRNAV